MESKLCKTQEEQVVEEDESMGGSQNTERRGGQILKMLSFYKD